ncbi:hypothetical protein PR202_gb24878 [Eleusine coracana subsp. coracana]|uniref:C2 domain-containing protein n=1 Tax=Eleusine coracana subsp. coracana TaxID=191504 RepID=A0AAV5FMP9_ELECO|nr:hypothetical protein PR202_gb24878 [Eleusine coracana subsp. coracana]
MASSSYQVLEVTLISAKDLKRVTFFSKMRVYAVASISGGDPRLPTHRTYADREGGRNPMWHAPLRFTIPRVGDHHNEALALHVLLRAERRAFGFGDRDVGEVVVPVADLAAAPAPDRAAGEQQQQRHLSYQHKSGGSAAVTAYPAAAERRPPSYHQQHSGHQYLPPYSGPYPHHHQYGYAGAYGYGAVPHHGPAHGYGQSGVATAARHDGGAGLGLGILGGAVGGMIIGDMIADADVMDERGILMVYWE